MKVSFSTLGCPTWSWERIIAKAAQMGYDGIELRGVNGEMDLTKATPFLSANLKNTKEQLEETGLEICCLGSSAKFDDKDTLRENIDSAKAYIDLAASLGAPYVRVFGDKIPRTKKRDRIIAQIVESLWKLADYAQGTGVKVIQETHGDFSRSEDILAVISQIGRPEVGILWDTHHPYKFAGEKPQDTWEKLGDFIMHTHFKDSTGSWGEHHYCLLGDGDVPIMDILRLLSNNGYKGWISFEWEKQWHPDILEPEVAFPQFKQKITEYLTTVEQE